MFVPAPWWKNDYFEVRFENPNENKRYFYQLDGEGIRNEMVAFCKAISEMDYKYSKIEQEITVANCRIMEKFQSGQIKQITLA